MSILMTSDVEGFFAEAMGEAMAACKIQVSGGARSYLVGLLVNLASKGMDQGALRRPVTLLLRDALEAPASERFEKLKGLGDSSLYVSGLFQDHLQAHGVDVGYVSTVGATAYRSAAALMQGADQHNDLFSELAGKFRQLVVALHEVANALFTGSADSPEGLLRVYDRWQKTGSVALGRELAAHGLVPLRNAGGVH